MPREIGNTDKDMIMKYLARNIFAESYGITDANLPKVKVSNINSIEWIEKHYVPRRPMNQMNDDELSNAQRELQRISEFSTVLKIEAPSILASKPFSSLIEVQAQTKLQLFCGEMLHNKDYKVEHMGSFYLGNAYKEQPDTYKLTVPIHLNQPVARFILEGIISADAKGLSETRDVYNALAGKQ